MTTHRELCWLAATVSGIYSAQTTQEYSRIVGDALDRRFSLLGFACEEVGPAASLYIPHRLRMAVALPKDWFAHFHDNPFTPLIGAESGRALLHMSHDVPRNAWQRTDHFNGIARPMGWNDQLMILAQNRGTLVAAGMYRDAVFTACERALVELLQPHLVAGWQRVRQPQAGVSAVEPLRIELGGDLRPVALTAGQQRVLAEYFPGWREPARLPEALRRWVADAIARLRGLPPPLPLHALRVNGPRGQLFVRCYPHTLGAGATLAIVELPRTAPSASALTSREREVLQWVALGKRDAEIAVVLDIAPATVSKHVEHVFAKLGVRSRTEAMRFALSCSGPTRSVREV